jgi:hypothetical protein
MVKVNPVAQPDEAQILDRMLMPAELETDGTATDTPITDKGSSEADDWRVKFEKLQEDNKKFQSKYEQDINGLKSSLQKDKSNAEKEWKAKEASYLEKIRQMEYSTLPDDQKSQYMAQLESQRFQDQQEQLQQREQDLANMQALQAWQKFFLDQGVKSTDLVGNDLNEIIASGYGALAKERDELRRENAELKSKVTTPEKKRAPSVVQPNGAPAVSNTWSDLIKKYGSMDKVYSLIETGMLSADILPS